MTLGDLATNPLLAAMAPLVVLPPPLTGEEGKVMRLTVTDGDEAAAPAPSAVTTSAAAAATPNGPFLGEFLLLLPLLLDSRGEDEAPPSA